MQGQLTEQATRHKALHRPLVDVQAYNRMLTRMQFLSALLFH